MGVILYKVFDEDGMIGYFPTEKAAKEFAELRTELAMSHKTEISMGNRLGRICRLCDQCLPYLLGLSDIPSAVREAADEIMEYVDHVRPS